MVTWAGQEAIVRDMVIGTTIGIEKEIGIEIGIETG